MTNTMHSKNYLKIKQGYKKGTWNKEMVYNVVGKKDGITPDEYKEITGEDYE